MPTFQNPRFDFDTLPPGSLVHLSGIAGTAMSGLAVILRQQGLAVQGTDPNAESVRKRLESQGVGVYTEQDGRHLHEGVRLVIATAAIGEEHPELRAAHKNGLRILRYAQALGALTARRNTLAVAGTHGKTTTSAMAVWILRGSGKDPGFLIGAMVRGLEQGAHRGEDGLFVAEACEYRRSFLELAPRRAIITNIEADHLDVYRDIEEIQEAFSHFTRGLDPDGLLIFCSDSERAAQVAASGTCSSLSYGFNENAQWRALDLDAQASGTWFTAAWRGEHLGRFFLPLPGRHNVANALAASLACRDMGVPLDAALSFLSSFPGASRRFELIGKALDISVIDDYAHHPTELVAVLEAARQRFPGQRIVCAFQPHQSSRTRLLLQDFAKALRHADLCLLVDIHSVRDSEADAKTVKAESLQAALVALGGHSETVGAIEGCPAAIATHLRPGDALLCVGAGPMDEVARALLATLSNS